MTLSLVQVVTFVFGSIILYKCINKLFSPALTPNLFNDKWWGEGNRPTDWTSYIANTSSVVNNRLLYPNSTIEDLHSRLNRTIAIVDPLEGVQFQYGFNTRFIQEIVDYWRDDYLPRWRSREVYLWQFNHFTTEIQGLLIHFFHLMVYDEYKVNRHHYPILLLHGWSGSVREFYSLIHKLHQTKKNKNNKYIFDVVVPSLPGYGWSQGTSKPGLGPIDIAIIFRKLMLRLGYEHFYIYGGDFSSTIGANIAALFPDNVLGFHSNMCKNKIRPKSIVKEFLITFLSNLFIPKSLEKYLSYPEKDHLIPTELGSIHLQTTKPDTIGNILTNNPIGLAIYMLDKYAAWTDRENLNLTDGGLRKKFKLDALLDNVMIYYLTNSITTSQRLYAEAYRQRDISVKLDRIPTKVPIGCVHFNKDILQFPDTKLQDKYKNVIHSTSYANGGHFAALESPNLLYTDVINFIKKSEEYKRK